VDEKSLIGQDPGLRSTWAVSGYHIQTSEGEIGHVTDFIINDDNWSICQLIVETGHWFSGKAIAIPPQRVGRISYEDSNISVDLTKEAIMQAPEYHIAYGWCSESGCGKIKVESPTPGSKLNNPLGCCHLAS
jgi:hypothetical protein